MHIVMNGTLLKTDALMRNVYGLGQLNRVLILTLAGSIVIMFHAVITRIRQFVAEMNGKGSCLPCIVQTNPIFGSRWPRRRV